MDHNTTTVTGYNHHKGDIGSLRNKFTAIGGLGGRMVEVYNNTTWSSTTIPPVGNYERGQLVRFTTLTINNTIYIFGMQCNTMHF